MSVTSIKQEFYDLRDSGVDPVEAIERVAAGRYLSPRGVAIRCDLAPTFVEQHWGEYADQRAHNVFWMTAAEREAIQ